MELQNKPMFFKGMSEIENAYDGKFKTLDWKKAREICENNPNSTIKAGIAEDWRYTHGVIFENGEYKNEDSCCCDECGFCVSSRWGTPVIVIDDGEPMECSTLTDEWEAKFPENWGD